MRRLLLPLVVLAALLAAPRAEAFRPPVDGAADAALSCAEALWTPELGPAGALDCLAALATGTELREAMACALRGRDVLGCLGIELGLIGACAYAAGASLEAAAGCVALRLAGQEAAKCIAVGIGIPGGCFGPGHEIRRLGRAIVEPEGWLGRMRGRVVALVPGS